MLRFLGLVNWFRLHIPRLAEIAAPLYDVLKGSNFNKKKNKFKPVKIDRFVEKWGPTQSLAWKTLKANLGDPRTLVPPRGDAKKRLYTDASHQAIAGVLLQEQEDSSWAPLAFLARSLKSAELNYTVSEKELLAIVYAVKKLRFYLHSREPFVVVTDHQAIKWLFSLKDPAGRLARWIVVLQEYNFTVEYRPGRHMEAPDCLSRDILPPQQETEQNLTERVNFAGHEPFGLPDQDTLIQQQQVALQQNEAHAPPTHEIELSAEGVVRWKGGIWVPEQLRPTILQFYHGHTLNGHFGVKRMLARITSRFYWKTVRADCERFIRNCAHCAVAHLHPPGRHAEMHIYTPCRRFKVVAIDTLSMSPTSQHGNNYVVSMGDLFTHYMCVVAVPTIHARVVAEAFVFNWVLRFGAPEKLLSDNGTEFCNEVLQHCCFVLGVKRIFTTPWHPQTNGMVERFNFTLCQELKARVNLQETDWDYYLPFAVYAYNTSEHSVLKCSPYQAMFGIAPMDVDRDVALFMFSEEQVAAENDITKQMKQLEHILFKLNMDAKVHAARWYDRLVKILEFKKGSRVLVYEPMEQKVIGRKLHLPW